MVPSAGHTGDGDELLAHCRARMAAFKRPRLIEVLDGLPKTATGKIQRYALRARLDRSGATPPPAAPAPAQ